MELYAAVTVTGVAELTVPADTVWLPLVCPAAMPIAAGVGKALGLLLVRVTVEPPGGAGPLKVTVTVPLFPAITGLGLTITELMAGSATIVT